MNKEVLQVEVLRQYALQQAKNYQSMQILHCGHGSFQAGVVLNKQKNAPHDIVVNEVNGVFDEIEKFLKDQGSENVLVKAWPTENDGAIRALVTIQPIDLLHKQATGQIEIW
ncbi:hypothetical protein [Furfurilactobacillus rossiae]|uniref:hypothetical protein n=1 Tax=Furfurilactobacillus rossiae TaxID=231049 RepID=UPI0002FBE2C5|nr:hypothetical protein [Furfurilactobacillus rossiae]QFR66464.1 hypothetical protein LR814_04865 [Furfurilactobacillus rossiae]QLE61925.1 hypothetical protein LROSRS0_1880 [Furfurilactobacillus rossiae]